MYSEWASLSPIIAANSNGSSSTVLNKFSSIAGRDVSQAVVKQLASNLGIAQLPEPSILVNDDEVNWCMSVICHGMSLPLSEHETIKDCVNVYCEWLTALFQTPKICVPRPICEDPNLYARKIINHFHNLFVPRQGEGTDLINRQAVLCHRVLRTLQQVAQSSQKLTPDTWESLLLFLLAINEVLLAPPAIKDDVSDQLCERVLSVLFEVWLIACVRNFPSPSLWKTLQESCLLLRHRIALIEQWNRVNLALTARLLEFLYGPTFPELKILEEDAQLIPSGMTNDCIAQTWYRFLRTIGSPIALCSPQIVSKTPQFMQWVVVQAESVETFHHPCLLQLPHIFLKAIKGIASQVDAFLGIFEIHSPEVTIDTTNSSTSQTQQQKQHPFQQQQQQQQNTEEPSRLSGSDLRSISAGFMSSSSLAINSSNTQSSSIVGVGTNTTGSGDSTPSQHRRLAKSFSVAPSQTTKALPSLGFAESRPPLAAARPKCNSVLHLLGEWLFEAAHIGGDAWLQNFKKMATEANRRPSSMIMDSRKGSLSLSQPSSLTEPADLPPALKIEKYESGKAEAIGALCRIFCAKKTGEEILPVYLARFYVALQQGLKIPENRECEETMASILYNSADLFRIDLDGIQVLLPTFITALEMVLPDKDLKMKANIVLNKSELRRASIQILLALLVLPLHYQTLPIRDLGTGSDKPFITFSQLKPRLINILMNAIQVESDPQNTHMLLGGLMLCVQDVALFEELADIGSDMRQTSSTPSDTNLLSSVYSDKSAYSGGSSSIDTNSTATLGNDYPSLTISDDLSADMLHEIDFSTNNDSAHALFVRATYLVCHRLISSWKTDLNISLAALELLSGLARMNRNNSDPLECKRAVRWICDYICYQCSRPPPAHSKDLHSTIVAAFAATAAWLMQHSYLLQDKECLTTVLETIELGISGSKSFGKPGEPIKLKDEKELKPVSMRVREAAETMLNLVLEQVGQFPNECGPQSISALLDELTLYKHCISAPNESTITTEQAIKRFRYFVTENSTILALLEEPLGNDQDPQPTITLLLRSPFGRHAWAMHLRHLPRSKSGTKYHASGSPGRPVPMNDMPMRHEVEQKFYPDGVERIQNCVADYSIPSIDAVIQKIGSNATTRLMHLLENQTVLEKLAWAETDNSDDSLGHAQESEPPPICQEFQAARLFLSHFGFLSIDDEKSAEPSDSMPIGPILTALDTTSPSFLNDLQSLDKLSPRTNDTLHMFYVKAGESRATEIIDNVSEENVMKLDKDFWNVLQNLGWPVNIEEHAGWTGFVGSSWKIQPSSVVTSKKDFNINTPDNMKFNGEKRILYWADVGAEIAFVLPTKWNKCDDVADGSCLSLTSSSSTDSDKDKSHPNFCDRSLSVQQGSCTKVGIGQKPRTLSLELDKMKGSLTGTANSNEPIPPTRRRTCAMKPSLLSQTGVKVFMVWLESFEDHLNFPVDDLLTYTRTGEEFQSGQITRASDVHIIFLHSLSSGLLRVKLQGPSGRINFATPLVDGMVVNKRVVGTLVRQTVYNVARRRRLDNDLFQPPHVRRRLKVLDMVHKYKLDMTEPELFAHLFKSPPFD